MIYKRTHKDDRIMVRNEKSVYHSGIKRLGRRTDGSASAKKNSVVTRYISRCALYTPRISSFVSWRPAFSFPPCPPSHFASRPIHALSTPTFHLSPCPQPHLPARPIHTHTSTFLSSLCTISASYYTRYVYPTRTLVINSIPFSSHTPMI